MITRLLLVLSYASGLTIILFLRSKLGAEMSLFWLGMIIGVFLPDLDYFIYVYFQNPQAEFSKEITAKIGSHHFKSALQTLKSHLAQMEKLSFRNVLTQSIFLIFAVYVLTSSGSLVGSGMTLAVFIGLLWEQWRFYQKNGHLNFWFWPLKTIPSKNFQTGYLVFMTLTLVFFTVLAAR